MALERCAAGIQLTSRAELLDSLAATAEKTPLDIVARAALSDPAMEPHARDVFAAYDAFLNLLDDPAKRSRIETITRAEAGATKSDAVFLEADQIGSDFGAAIERFFFDGTYAQAIRTYGVF